MRYSLLLIFVFISQVVCAQTDSLINLQKVGLSAGSLTNFTVDNLGNLYLVNADNQLRKIDTNGDSVAVYNDVKRYGRIHSIDASNPLKILVYYKDFATVVVLDKLLTARNTIDLRKQNIYQVQAVATSYDGNIWIYDELESKIKKISDNGKMLLESADLRQVLSQAPQPSVMWDKDGQLYLYDSSRGLLVFDYYGAQKNNFPITHIQDLQVLDKNTITGRQAQRFIRFSPSTLQVRQYRINQSMDSFLKVLFTGSRLYALAKQGTLQVFAAY